MYCIVCNQEVGSLQITEGMNVWLYFSLKMWQLHWTERDPSLPHLIRNSANLTRALLKKKQSQKGQFAVFYALENSNTVNPYVIVYAVHKKVARKEFC